ncbi:hypothetical protein LINGRAHAP2_LOCUS24244 [Linum grandiflorum]
MNARRYPMRQVIRRNRCWHQKGRPRCRLGELLGTTRRCLTSMRSLIVRGIFDEVPVHQWKVDDETIPTTPN